MSEIGHLTLICFGSNDFSTWGDVRETVQKSISLVTELSEGTFQISSLYQTPAFPAGAGPDFVNAAIAMRTRLSPDEMLDHLHRIEALAGRERVKRWGQRTLDLDLIAMDDLVCPNPQVYDRWRTLPAEAQQTEAPDQLILPHPRMQDRSFVLVPLADVAPDWVHPLLHETVQEMLAKRPIAERETVVPLA